MTQVLVLYPHPADPQALDRHYFGTHANLVKRIPGLRRLEVSRGPILSPQGPSPYHMIIQLTYDSVEAVQAAMATEESRLATADLANFAPPGRQSFIFDTQIL